MRGPMTSTVEVNWDTLIEDIIEKINPDLEDSEMQRLVTQCHKNWIFNVGGIWRIPKEGLGDLGLPVILQYEFSRLQTLASSGFSDNMFIVDSHDNSFKFVVSPNDKKLLKASFEAIHNFKDPRVPDYSGLLAFGVNFYSELFSLHPSSKRLFDISEMAIQANAFSNMLKYVINNIDNTRLFSIISELGGRHIIYGVTEDDYKAFAQSLEKTLVKCLGPEIATDEVCGAWSRCITQMSTMMQRSGELMVKEGFSGVLRRQRSNGAWVAHICKLSLHSLTIFKDKNCKRVQAQYPLYGVVSVKTRTTEEPKNAFVLASVNPPFKVSLASNSEEELREWMQQIQWRVQALHRVSKYQESNHTEAAQEAISSGESGKHKWKLLKTTSIQRIVSSPLSSPTHYDKLRASEENSGRFREREMSLKCISAEEIEIIKNSWTKLSTMTVDKNGHPTPGITIFFEEFYRSFFKVNETGIRLFEGTALTAQGKALVRMISFLVITLDKPENFEKQILPLGGRHTIYGVKPEDYYDFSHTLTVTLARLVSTDPKEMRDIQDAWSKLLAVVSTLMINHGEKVKKEGYSQSIYSLCKNSWKKSLMLLSLEAVIIYKSETMDVLRTSIPFQSLEAIHIQESDVPHPPFEYTISLVMNNTQKVFLAFPTEDERDEWLNQLNWRVGAFHRVYRGLMSTSDSTEGPESAPVRHSRSGLWNLKSARGHRKKKSGDLTSTDSARIKLTRKEKG